MMNLNLFQVSEEMLRSAVIIFLLHRVCGNVNLPVGCLLNLIILASKDSKQFVRVTIHSHSVCVRLFFYFISH